MRMWDFSQNGHFDSCLAAQLLSSLRNWSTFTVTPEVATGSVCIVGPPFPSVCSGTDASMGSWFSAGHQLPLCKSGVGVPVCAWAVLVSLLRKRHSARRHSAVQGRAEVPGLLTICCHLLQGSPCGLAWAFLQDTALHLGGSGQRGWPWHGCLLILPFSDEEEGSCVE